MFFVCLGNADVEVYRRLNGVAGDVVGLANSDGIGLVKDEEVYVRLKVVTGAVVVVKVNFE